MIQQGERKGVERSQARGRKPHQAAAAEEYIEPASVGGGTLGGGGGEEGYRPLSPQERGKKGISQGMSPHDRGVKGAQARWAKAHAGEAGGEETQQASQRGA